MTSKPLDVIPDKSLYLDVIPVLVFDVIPPAFESLYFLNSSAKVEVLNPKHDLEPTPTNFSIAKESIREYHEIANIIKSKGPEAIYPVFFQKMAEPISHALHLILRAIKRTNTKPDEWKVCTETPIHTKEDKHIVENNRPVTLSNFSSKVLERCLCEPLYEHLMNNVTNYQHGCSGKFCNNGHVAVSPLCSCGTGDKESKNATRVFYTDFAKAFDKVPHHVLLKKKMENLSVGSCFLRFLENYLNGRTHFFQTGNIRSATMNIPSGVPQGSIIGPHLFCISMNDLSETVKNSDILLFADDIKFITTTTIRVKKFSGSGEH